MKRAFYPFGRGDRATKQRLMLVVEVRRAGMVYHAFTVEVNQTAMSSVVLFHVGTSKSAGQRRAFVTGSFQGMVTCFLKGVKQFRQVREANKVHRQLREGKSVDAQRSKFYKLIKARDYARNTK